jgi:putative tryptophan/tyrosine transport system substrate-binding protein
MKRRKFIALTGSAAVWSFAARAQLVEPERSSRPVIGFLNNMSSESWRSAMPGLRQGLSEVGFVEGQNVAFAYRWTEGKRDLLPELAADLARSGVALIIASADTATALAARAAAPHIPVVFVTEDDPVRFGLAAGLDQPGGRATGLYLTKVWFDVSAVSAQRELWRLLVPGIQTFLRIEILDASSIVEKTDPDVAFASNLDFARRNNPRVIIPPIRAIEIDCGPFLDERRRNQLVSLAARHRIPTLYYWRIFAEEGGLITCGISLTDVYERIGRYGGDILRGRNPAEMPILKPSKPEAVLNLRTEAELGLNVSSELLARVDKVIE